jgi:hypothetical protein
LFYEGEEEAKGEIAAGLCMYRCLVVHGRLEVGIAPVNFRIARDPGVICGSVKGRD